ncbi:hypothetical protein [Cypionkella sp.]|nr:hypothetical protein [Cypionkella sp.]
MKRLSVTLTLSLAVATQTSAFSFNVSLLNLAFVPTTTAQDLAHPGK